MDGGLAVDSALTVILIGAFVAAWKAPKWLREVGVLAIVTALISLFAGLHSLFYTLQQVDGEIAPGVFYGALKCATVPVIYGLAIDLVTVILRFATKPRRY